MLKLMGKKIITTLRKLLLINWPYDNSSKYRSSILFHRYTFYDGPPFATGLPHYGHILAGTIKDVVTRWAHQSGYHVERRFGWDCHGLPVVW